MLFATVGGGIMNWHKFSNVKVKFRQYVKSFDSLITPVIFFSKMKDDN